MGRNRKPGKRIGNRLSRAKADVIARGEVLPAPHVIRRRNLFERFAANLPHEFAIPPTGELRRIDQSHDGIGRLWLVGLLSDHGIDPVELRDKGRTYGELWRKYWPGKTKAGSHERAAKSTSESAHATLDERLFLRMDDALTRYDRQCLVDLTDPENGDSVSPWITALVCEKMRERGVLMHKPTFPTLDDRGRLEAAIRGLAAIVDGSLPQRWERAA